ncbi:MAG: hypothetical protein RBT65_01825 [Methanolobus sp.]|jgi:DNA repair exonuclease SbcCD nuclease subunit|nr:hypothetical protein [Methanolobus sp.]
MIPEINHEPKSQKTRNEASYLRRCGKMLDMGEHIKSPVLAIHGNHNPHPFQGLKAPLSKLVKDFRFTLLNNCGQYPLQEKHASEELYQVIENELF